MCGHGVSACVYVYFMVLEFVAGDRSRDAIAGMYVCMYVYFMTIEVWGTLCSRRYVCMHVCMCVCICVCMYVCMPSCMCVWMFHRTSVFRMGQQTWCVSEYVCMQVCIYVSMHAYTHTHSQKALVRPSQHTSS